MKFNISKLKLGGIAVLAVLVLGSFTAIGHLNNKSVQKVNLLTNNDPAKEYDEGYKEGYCEGFRDGIGDRYFNCPPPPYINNDSYRQGCANYYKCGYSAGFKHGMTDGRKYRR
jgi:hypothetical protein